MKAGADALRCVWCGRERALVVALITDERTTVCDACLTYGVGQLDRQWEKHAPGTRHTFLTAAVLAELETLGDEATPAEIARLVSAALALSGEVPDECRRIARQAADAGAPEQALRALALIGPDETILEDAVSRCAASYELGDYAAARAALADADALGAADDETPAVAEAWRIAVALRDGSRVDDETLRTWIARLEQDGRAASERFELLGRASQLLVIATVYAECLLRAGRARKAASALEDLERTGVGLGAPTRFVRGEALAACGDLEGARREWLSARSSSRAGTMTRHHADARLARPVSAYR